MEASDPYRSEDYLPNVECYPGDILCTTSPTFNSTIIQNATCSRSSHAVLMLEGNKAIEAVPEGVIETDLFEVMAHSSSVILLRHKHITYAQGLHITKFAKAQIGKRYDTTGAARAGVKSGCAGLFSMTVPGMLVQLVDTIGKLGKDEDNTFFCSELVARAYESVGLRLSSKRPWQIIPGGLLRSDQLKAIARFK